MPLDKLILHQEYAQRFGRRTITLHFKPGVNLLVGPNGSGKSTIIECLRHEVLVKEKRDEWGEKKKVQKRHAKWTFTGVPLDVLYFDFEKDNPRIGRGDGTMSMQDLRRMQMRWRYSSRSHGEFTRDVLKDMDAKIDKHKGRVFIVLDEPEQALDLDGIRMLHSILTKRTTYAPRQAVIATHHPFLMADPSVNVIEMKEGYRQDVLDAIVAIRRQII